MYMNVPFYCVYYYLANSFLRFHFIVITVWPPSSYTTSDAGQPGVKSPSKITVLFDILVTSHIPSPVKSKHVPIAKGAVSIKVPLSSLRLEQSGTRHVP